MNPNPRPVFKTYHGILALHEQNQELCLVRDTGEAIFIHETYRTRGLRHLLWEPVRITGWVSGIGFERRLEVIDFSSQEEPPETLTLDDEFLEPKLAYNGEPIPISG